MSLLAALRDEMAKASCQPNTVEIYCMAESSLQIA
jgi:hypothetical protein